MLIKVKDLFPLPYKRLSRQLKAVEEENKRLREAMVKAHDEIDNYISEEDSTYKACKILKEALGEG